MRTLGRSSIVLLGTQLFAEKGPCARTQRLARKPVRCLRRQYPYSYFLAPVFDNFYKAKVSRVSSSTRRFRHGLTVLRGRPQRKNLEDWLLLAGAGRSFVDIRVAIRCSRSSFGPSMAQNGPRFRKSPCLSCVCQAFA